MSTTPFNPIASPGGHSVGAADGRPKLAIIANSLTPYRQHQHLRIARELPEVSLATVLTHSATNADWDLRAAPEIAAVMFGAGEHSDEQAKLLHSGREWRKGGQIIQWMAGQGINAVVVLGYNDLARLRILRWCAAIGMPCFLFGDSNIAGDHARGLKAIVKRAVVGYAIRKATGVLPCGSLGRAYFEKYGARPDRMFYFPYEPDYGLIRELSPAYIADVAFRLHLAPGRCRLVFSGRMTQVKRPDLVIDAFQQIASARPVWDLVMLGEGGQRQQLENRVLPELKHRVHWLGFLPEQKEVSAVYRVSDVLVLPSDYEPWALVINEAVAAGMAIVCTSVVGAAAELVRDGVNGRLFEPGRLDALVGDLLDVTDQRRLGTMKEASASLLADWRRRADPIDGLRRALEFAGILPAQPAHAWA